MVGHVAALAGGWHTVVVGVVEQDQRWSVDLHIGAMCFRLLSRNFTSIMP